MTLFVSRESEEKSGKFDFFFYIFFGIDMHVRFYSIGLQLGVKRVLVMVIMVVWVEILWTLIIR